MEEEARNGITMWEIPLLIVSVVGIGVTLGGILIKHFGRISQGMVKLGERITRVETKVELFWKGIEGNIANLLKSPNHPRKDELLEKLPNNGLNLKEAIELKGILEEEFSHKRRSNPLGLAYALAITRLDQVVFDLKDGSK